MREIGTKRGHVILVSDEDYDLVSDFRWSILKGKHTKYAICARKGRPTILMHRLIISPPSRYVVDHIDFNGLNNQRSNLRVCTHGENVRRQRRKPGASFKGAYLSGSTWQAKIHFNGNAILLGRYPDAESAARAYDSAARELFGEFAVPNFDAASDNNCSVNQESKLLIFNAERESYKIY